MATIVIGVDLSHGSRRAFDAGVGLALDLKARVVVVHGFRSGTIGRTTKAGALQEHGSSLVVDDEEEVRRLSSAWLEAARGRGARVAIVAEHSDDPASLILEQARHHDAAMVVVGSHGQRGISRVPMGSIAEAVVRDSDRPVLVVPAR